MNKTTVKRSFLAWVTALALLTASVAMLGALPTQPARAATADNYKINEVVVKLNPASNATISAINTTYGTTTLGVVGGLVGVYRLGVPSGQDAAALAVTMAGDARLLYAHPNFVRAPPEANPRSSRAWGGFDPAPYASQYAQTMLGLSSAHTVTQGSGAVVAVIDTGLQLNHPAFSNTLTAARYDFVDNDTVPDDVGNNIDDDSDGLVDEAVGHGTHVAGIVLMVAPAAKIMPLRVLDSDGLGDDGVIVQAIDYAVNNGANVINLSLGTVDKSDVLDEAIQRATRQGVVVVSAAGNANSTTKQYPAAQNCVISVTSVGQGDVKSSFSNYGSWVDISSPGENIYSMLDGGGYGTWSGTSMAVPFVAGQAALIHAVRGSFNPWAVSAIIANSAKDIRNQNPDFNSDLGEGRIDVAASVALAASHVNPPTDGALISSSCVEPESSGTQTPTPSTTPTTPTVSPSPGGTPSPTSTLPARAFLPLAIRAP